MGQRRRSARFSSSLVSSTCTLPCSLRTILVSHLGSVAHRPLLPRRILPVGRPSESWGGCGSSAWPRHALMGLLGACAYALRTSGKVVPVHLFHARSRGRAGLAHGVAAWSKPPSVMWTWRRRGCAYMLRAAGRRGCSRSPHRGGPGGTGRVLGGEPLPRHVGGAPWRA
jgi:hypothetical protein